MLLYIIAPDANGPCKVGYAQNVYKRLSSLQIGNHLKLSLCSVWRSSQGRSVIQCERLLHRALARNRIRGEWFSVSVAMAEQAALDAGMAQVLECTTQYDYDRKPKPGDTRLSWLI